MWHNGKPKELGPLRAKPNFQTLLYFEAEILKFGSSVAAKEHFYRLDPVRGCFLLTASEASELLQRYRAYGFGEKLCGAGNKPRHATAWPLVVMAS